jgi:hypothetical protein
MDSKNKVAIVGYCVIKKSVARGTVIQSDMLLADMDIEIGIYVSST